MNRQHLYKAANEPKHFYIIDGKHNDFMYNDHPVFQSLISELITFFNVHFTETKVKEVTRA